MVSYVIFYLCLQTSMLVSRSCFVSRAAHFFNWLIHTVDVILSRCLNIITMPNWNSSDDAKLASLFRRGHKNGGLNPRNLSKEYIEQHVIAKHWPRKKYTSFRPLYVGKARQWNVNQTLTGNRRKSSELH